MTPNPGIDLLRRADELTSRRMRFVLATVVWTQPPTSAKPGDRALLLPDGTIEGFVGGACSETTVRTQGLRQLAAGRSALLRITPLPADPATPADPAITADPAVSADPADSHDGIVTAVNPCLSGGLLDIFLEVMEPAMLVHVYGDTPVAQAIVDVAKAAGLQASRAASADAPIAADTAAVVVASQGDDEARALTAALKTDVPYIGLLASRKRGAAVAEALELDAAGRARLRTPVGLDIGARTPGEVAVSIIAEIIAAVSSPAVSSDRPIGVKTQATTITEAVDPVCGMTVAATLGAVRLEAADGVFYFCCRSCRDAYVADPGRYTRTL